LQKDHRYSEPNVAAAPPPPPNAVIAEAVVAEAVVAVFFFLESDVKAPKSRTMFTALVTLACCHRFPFSSSHR